MPELLALIPRLLHTLTVLSRAGSAGYLAYATASLFSWQNRDYDYDHDAEMIKEWNFAGALMFTVGSALLAQGSDFPWKDNTESQDFIQHLMGAGRIFYGCISFLIGSVMFLIAAIFDLWNEPHESATTEIRLYQAGILVFLVGRLFFLFDPIQAVRAGAVGLPHV